MIWYLLTIFGLASITNLWLHSEPTNKIKHWLYKSVDKKEELWHWRLINCALCTGFWLGLIVTWNLYLAAIIAVVAELICKKLTNDIW
jgi:hypothetical protein